MRTLWTSVFASLFALVPIAARAAELPAHDPMRIMVISDEVNPHGLSDAELTQPGDLKAAFDDPASGLELASSVREVNSQCIDEALVALPMPGDVDVLVYFAHLGARACSGTDKQGELTSAVEGHLRAGGGVVVFHHGIYEAAGKNAMLQLLGGAASSVAWDTTVGQDVVAVAPDHFVTTNGMQYDGSRPFEMAGVRAGEYSYFNNTPDERYDSISALSTPDETRTILFASDDAGGGGKRVLGYDLHRPGWIGHVVFYQPGEYQPRALDDLAGSNFQILANAIVYAATTHEEDPGEDDTGGDATDDGSTIDDSGGDGADTASPSDDTAGGEPTASADGNDDTGIGTGGSTMDSTAADGGGSGCACATARGDDDGGWAMTLVLAGIGVLVRTRRAGCTMANA